MGAHIKPHTQGHEGPGGQWEPVGLNERMRFLRYQPGDYFKPHQDGSFARNDGPRKGERSFLTLMLYLDEPGSGGETKFLNPQLKTETSVHPRGGLGLVFDHELLHEGATLIAGVKHALRTDVMYRRVQGSYIKFASLEEMLSLRQARFEPSDEVTLHVHMRRMWSIDGASMADCRRRNRDVHGMCETDERRS